MAQIALRKTANENKVEYPKAAEVLEKNTYMDDICESVDTNKKLGNYQMGQPQSNPRGIILLFWS